MVTSKFNVDSLFAVLNLTSKLEQSVTCKTKLTVVKRYVDSLTLIVVVEDSCVAVVFRTTVDGDELVSDDDDVVASVTRASSVVTTDEERIELIAENAAVVVATGAGIVRDVVEARVAGHVRPL